MTIEFMFNNIKSIELIYLIDAFCASQWPLVRLPVATWRYE